MTSRFSVRVYYEDTDAGGVVYYANYLKFIERARTEALIGLGVSQTRLQAQTGKVFAVRAVQASYEAPARLEDELEVVTAVTQVSGARITMAQDILRGDATLFRSVVTLVCVGPDGRAARIPQEVATLLSALAATPSYDGANLP